MSAVVLLTIPLLRVATCQATPLTPVPTKVEITERISRLTGLNAIFEIESIDEIPANSANTPFLSKSLTGNAIKVTFQQGALKLKSALPGAADKYERQFVVTLDATAKHLLSVFSPSMIKNPDIHRESVEEAEKLLRQQGETYSAWPESDPKVSFLEALEIIQKDGVSQPLLSQEIEGFYVMHSEIGLPTSPQWIITLRGGPPHPRMPKSIPLWQRNHSREFVDAMAGKWLSAASYP